MNMPKNTNSSKPKISKDIKQKLNSRMQEVNIKFGFTRHYEFKLDNADLETILTGMDQMGCFNENPDKYFSIPANGKNIPENIVAVVVRTPDDSQPARHSKRKNASEKKAGVEDKHIQDYLWDLICDGAPNNLLRVWMTKDQYAELQFNEVYVLIGILQVQFSKKKTDEAGNVVKDKAGKNIYVETTADDPEGYENHSLQLIEFME